MKINQLRYFLAVADKGSVRAAATALGVSAAAVSQALRELETAMGTPLLKRESHGAVLSYAGRQFLIHARLILGQVSRAEAEIAQIRGATGGTLTIGATPWVAQSILPHALARFHALRPDVHLDVTEAVGTVHPLLRDGTLDLVIAIPPPRQEASIFYTRDLFRCDLAIVGRLGHPFAGASSLEELDDQDWVLTMLGSGQDEPLVNLLAPTASRRRRTVCITRARRWSRSACWQSATCSPSAPGRCSKPRCCAVAYRRCRFATRCPRCAPASSSAATTPSARRGSCSSTASRTPPGRVWPPTTRRSNAS